MKQLFNIGLMITCLLVSVCTRDKKFLAIDFQPGAVYQYTVSTTHKLSRNTMGKTIELTQTLTWCYIFQIINIDKRSIATIDVTFDEIGLESTGPFGAMAWRSWEDSSGTSGSARIFSILVDKHITIRLLPDGQILSVVGTEPIINEMITTLGIEVDSASIDRAREELKNQFGDQAMGETLGKIFPHFAHKPVAAGDAWGDLARLACGLPVLVRNTWHVSSLHNGMVVLDAYGIIEPNPDIRFTNVPGTELYYNLRGQKNGKYLIDGATGWVSSGILEQRAEGVAVFCSVVAGQLQSMQWPLSVTEMTRIDAHGIKDSTAVSN